MAPIGRFFAGQNAKQGRFPGAIRPNETDPLAGINAE
jgi:hypothetical protein